MVTTLELVQGFFLYVGWWLIPLLFLFVYKKLLGKYPLDVVIYEKRGDNLIKTNDVAGRFNDPVNCYKLKLSKDSIPIPQYDWVLQCAHKPTNLFEKIPNMLAGKIGSVTLFKYSSKQYKPIQVKLADGQMIRKFKEIKDNKGNPVFITVYEPINPQRAMSKLDFEVIDWDDVNHMTQELRAIALRRSPVQSFLEKYGPITALILAVLALIIAGYYYKEMIMDAGNKLYSASGGGQVIPQPNENINKDPGVPIIGDLFNPGKT